MLSGQKVVIVDGVPETAEVLRAVFTPQGHKVERVRGFAFDHANTASDSVLVVHDDADSPPRRFKYGNAPRVVIGSLTTSRDSANGQQLSPFFQYAELIKAVEGLLNEQREATSKAA